MGIQVPLLVIDRRRVSVMSTLFSNHRVRTLNVTMTVIMSLCILMYRRLFGVSDVIGHDEESRNGRDIKIDILEAYIWTSESFWVKSAFYWSTRGLPEPPLGVIGPSWAIREKRRAGQGRPRAPSP